jgi:proteic killer suppression protein
MILTFRDAATEDLYHGRKTARVRHFPAKIIPVALRKMDMLARAYAVMDLRAPPGNRLEVLKGDLEGFYSIRINDQWHLVFRWEGHNALDVAIMDYHT